MEASKASKRVVLRMWYGSVVGGGRWRACRVWGVFRYDSILLEGVCEFVFVLEGGGGREGRTTLLGNIRDLVRSLLTNKHIASTLMYIQIDSLSHSFERSYGFLPVKVKEEKNQDLISLSLSLTRIESNRSSSQGK